MKRKKLEMALQRVKPFVRPRPTEEQYPTPATIAADMLFTAHAQGDISGLDVADLGCGTGILGIGAALLGAKRVIGVDKDGAALEMARENAALLEVEISLLQGDVSELEERVGTVVMNPPFGSQRRHADLPFLEKAMEIADVSYSLHNANTEEFLLHLVSRTGRRAEVLKRYKFEIPHTFAFHNKEKVDVEVLLLRIWKQGEM